METLKIDTSQNIDIEQSIASIGERIAATIIDFFIIICYSLVVMFVFGISHSNVLLTILSIPASIYSIACELMMNGQSWGKKIMKIKVVKLDGTPTSFLSYFLRWILRLIEIIATFGSLATVTIILNNKGQRIGDIAANTTIIRLREKNLKESIYIQLPDNYTPVYPEVSRLSNADIHTIKEVLQLLKNDETNEQNLTIANKAQKAIEQKLNIKSDQNTAVFFQTILYDYNYINIK